MTAAVDVSRQPRLEQRRHSMCGDVRRVDLPGIDEILTDPTTSIWLKSALQAALCRDPVDAANDSEILARLLELRCNRLLGKGQRPVSESG
jgi:hypothetical protein